MAVNCGVSFGLCNIRITEVDAQGNVAPSPNNYYVTDNPLSITLTPNIETGNTVSVRNGCGCSVARFKFNDIFNWFEFTFGKDVLEPAMESLMTGDTPITDAGLVVGVNGASALDCDEEPTYVGFEMWAKHYVGNAPDATYKLVHWVFPRTRWWWGDNTQEEGVGRTVLNGVSASNPLWGSGPYGDGPPDGSDVVEWARWFTNDDLPTATACGELASGAIGS